MSKLPDAIKWVEDEVPVNRIPPVIEDWQYQPQGNRLIRKLGENIFVPIGLIATTACLTMGLWNMKKGNSQAQQFYMRGRVLAQGFTLAAITFGIYMTEMKKRRIQAKTDEK